MERAESPTEFSSSPSTKDDAPTINVQDEPEMMDSPMASPTTTQPTTAPDSIKGSPSQPQHKESISVASSSSSINQFHQQQQQSSRQTSGEQPIRRRQGTHGHRNSSFEYKETLNATTRHLEDGSRIINQYKLYDMIGQGAYGNVYEACLLQDPSVKFAVKEFGKTRLRKTHRAANFRKPIGRGGSRGVRGGFAARGARGGRESQGGIREEGGEPQEDKVELDGLTGKVAKMTMEEEKKRGSKEDEPPRADDPLSLIRHEIAILKKLEHPHVVELYEVLDDPTKDGLYMVFEHCADGRVIDVRLHEQVKPLDEETARDYLVQIMLGIEYLHYNDIVHRDIKPDNILLQDNRKTCKIVDFGVSEMFTKPGDDTLQKSAGSPAFMSPELCSANHGDFHGKHSDIWSLGVTFYCMVVGRLPFDKSQFLELYDSINGDEPDYPSHLSNHCKDLLQKLMTKDAKKRITLAEMRNHPYITKEGTIKITSEDENTSAIVVEVTDEEVNGAIKKIISVFTLARAISKFKRAGSRASSSGSMSDMASNLANKGRDLASEAEKGQDDREEGEEGLSYEHLAAAHIALGVRSTAHAAKYAAKAVLEKSQMINSPEAVEESQEEEQKKGPPGANGDKNEGYFGKAAVGKDDKEEEEQPKGEERGGKSRGDEDEGDKSKEGEGGAESQEDEGGDRKEDEGDDDSKAILQGPNVSSPLTEDFPAPQGAGAEYEGKSKKEAGEEEVKR